MPSLLRLPTALHPPLLLRGVWEFGKSVFVLYFVAGLIGTESSIFNRLFVLLSCCPEKKSERCSIRVDFNGVVTEAEFYCDAENGAFAILDRIASKLSPTIFQS
jgi:hypothetical protein